MKEFKKLFMQLKKHKRRLSDIYGIREIGIFGSYRKGKQTKKSDLDILVSFYKPIDLFKFMDLEDEISLLTNKKADLVMKSALKPYIGKKILSEVVYV